MFVQIKCHVFFKGKTIARKKHCQLLKILSRTIGPISTNLCTKHFMVKGNLHDSKFVQKKVITPSILFVFLYQTEYFGIMIVLSILFIWEDCFSGEWNGPWANFWSIRYFAIGNMIRWFWFCSQWQQWFCEMCYYSEGRPDFWWGEIFIEIIH